MKTIYIELADAEFAAIYALAGAICKDQGMTRKEALAYIEKLKPPNVLRVALGLPIRHRGAYRPIQQRRKAKEKL